MSFFWSSVHPAKDTRCILSPSLLCVLGSVRVPLSFLSLHYLDGSEEYPLGIYRSMVSLYLGRMFDETGILGLEKVIIEVKCPSHHTCNQPEWSLVKLILITWLRQCWPGFSACKGLFFPPHPTLIFDSKSLKATSPHFRD